MKAEAEIDGAMADYWLRRFGSEAEKTAFAEAFTAVQSALAAGHTLLELSELTEPAINHPLLIGHVRQGQYAAPLLSDGEYLWLNRIYQSEQALAKDILTRLVARPAPLDLDETTIAAYCQSLNQEQSRAVRQALSHGFTMINGGPGTGKTSTVAQLVALLAAAGQTEHLALAAPTGKAAKRMEEALNKSLKEAGAEIKIAAAQTLHRLLGINGEGKAYYHRENPLPHRVIIIDEASMLSLELAAQLFAAVAADARLILLGDADQLAAVEAGAVLQDLSRHPRLQDALVTLKENYRFGTQSGIGQLAQLVLQGDAAVEKLAACFAHYDNIHHYELESDIYQQLAQGYAPYFAALNAGAAAQTLLSTFDEYRILLASHHGVLGTAEINRRLRHIHLQQVNLAYRGGHFHGLPLMITANDYRNEVFNGDIGLCLEDENGRLRLHLPHKQVLIERLNPAHLQEAYALTIHKSQGSEFRHVALVLAAGQQDKLLSRELLYTGITRAKEQLSLYAPIATLQAAIRQPTQRSTGLERFL